MKRTLILILIPLSALLSCSKKSTSSPTPSNVVEYDFSADATGQYVVNYYDAVSLGSAQNVSSNSWTQKVTIPAGTKTVNIFFTAGQNPPFVANNTGTVTIKLNGKIVATRRQVFTSTSTLAEASYTFTGN